MAKYRLEVLGPLPTEQLRARRWIDAPNDTEAKKQAAEVYAELFAEAAEAGERYVLYRLRDDHVIIGQDDHVVHECVDPKHRRP